jgi:hypothetical protein
MLLKYIIRLSGVLFLLVMPTAFLVPLSASSYTGENVTVPGEKDSADIQILYNGRAWRNLYYRIRGDQFLFTNAFMKGSVTIDGQTFDKLLLCYDIFNDELVINTELGILIQLNKEMIDFFSLEFNNKNYKFRRLDADSVNSLSGNVNVLYEDGLSLYVKYRKEILLLAVDNKFDLFNESSKVYMKKEGVIYRIGSKGEFLNLLKDHKQEIHKFLKSNNIHLSKSNPESMAQVLGFYEKLLH